ncbi:NEDD8-activating enzyme E1 catalytic subunit [Cardiosporidium cionae]|uniref:NEDD8-activating enzyme E1 catalytic subunit n=1 Tax=Cardiosporidium cionae TaxID=476202 RepID=A0ABQ7JAH8_9APIC|nr:NEDD8-activating enzyme E1 catalytic subunit [Cardiosporidium cionae]|eukprot:KAF8820660.1 NEDD8-activating enzyme E1 catalytic subunit [Cardiosporidium cionae]
MAEYLSHLQCWFERKQPYADEAFQTGEATLRYLREECMVLVIGAGGLGCEILKNLALSGFCNIHVIDMDTIELSNLNRQFLFRKEDIGFSKAKIAANKINKRFSYLGVTVTPYVGRIEEKEDAFYSQFNIILSGLDSIEARRWINAVLHRLVVFDEAKSLDIRTVIPLFDGGSEGFRGHSRVILPMITPCFECSLDMFPPKVSYPLCTLAETPRSPEHCIEYAMTIQWEKKFPEKPLNREEEEAIQWVYETAKKRAMHFGISGVTLSLTMGIMKNIIPAVASTNALISASLVNEAMKLCTYTSPVMNNYLMYTGDRGVYTFTFELQKEEMCSICNTEKSLIVCNPKETFQNFMDRLKMQMGITQPSFTTQKESNSIYSMETLSSPIQESLLSKTLQDLVDLKILYEREALYITDPSLPAARIIRFIFSMDKEDFLRVS